MTAPINLAVLTGSTRVGRFGATVTDWLAATIVARDDFKLDLLDLADLDLPSVWTRDETPALVDYWARLDAADAFVVVTPEYNHSYTAPLKQAIDLSRGQFNRKPIGFVSYGGMSGGLRAVEHLRPVFAEVRAATIRETVSFHMAWERFGSDGQPLEPAVAEATKVMLDELAWWGEALRAGRTAG